MQCVFLILITLSKRQTFMFFLLTRRFVLKENMRNEKGKKRGQMLILFGTFCWFAFRRLETLPTVIRITQLTSHMFLRF